MNHLEERVNDTIWAMKKQLNSDSDVNYTTVQFHGNRYNSQSDCVDWAEILKGVSRQVFLPWVNILGQSVIGKASQYLLTEVV
jgi:hypothetical protein